MRQKWDLNLSSKKFLHESGEFLDDQDALPDLNHTSQATRDNFQSSIFVNQILEL